MQKHSFRLFASLTCVALLVTPTLAQVNGPGPSAPSLFDTVVNLSGSTPPFGNDIGGVAGQTIQVNVNSGGIFGRASGYRLLLLDGAELNVNGGTVDPDVRAQSGSEVNINSGSVGNSFVAEFGSVVNITGGTVDFSADAFGEVNISGGTVGRSFDARGGNVTISGGSVGYFFRANSSTELIGGEFRLNGAAFTGNSISLAEGDIFTGTLADGSSFIFTTVVTNNNSDQLVGVELTSVPLPVLNLNLTVNNPVTSGPSGLRGGQSLTLANGGELRDNFAVVGATLNVTDGIVGEEVEVTEGVINISGGSVGRELSALAGSQVNISGGTLGESANAFAGSQVNISGGILGDSFDALLGSEVNISGGTIGSFFDAEPGSQVTISGGSIGNVFVALPGSNVEFIGGEFRLNGAAFTGNTISLASGDSFSGTLADGSSFFISSADADAFDNSSRDPLSGFIIFGGDRTDVLQGVTVTNVSLPVADLTPIVIDTPSSTAPAGGLRLGQSLTLEDTGELADQFSVVGATLDITGGSVGERLEVAEGVVNISGGTVGNYLDAGFDSEVNISGGIVGNFFDALTNSEVNISGGAVGERFDAHSNSVINISGGSIGEFFDALSGSEVNISGGTFAENFEAFAQSQVNIFGREFSIDGVALDSLVLNQSRLITPRNVTLSGVLANGEPFSFDLNFLEHPDAEEDFFSSGMRLRVTLVPEPVLLGDVDRNGVITFADIAPFIALLSAGDFQGEADCDQNGVINFSDIAPFIAILQEQ